MEINHVCSKSSVVDDSFSINSGGSVLSPSKYIVNCKHSRGTQDIYCRTHHMMACRTCLVKQHALCDVHNISDVSKEFDKESVEKMIKEIEAIKIQISDAIKGLRNEKSLLHKEKEMAIKKIKHFRSKMSKRLEEFEKEALQSLDLTFIQYQRDTEDQLKEAEQCLESYSESLNTMTPDGEQSMSRIVHFKETQKAIKDTQESLHKLKVQLAEIEFIPDSKLYELMSDAEPRTLGDCRLNFKRDPTVLYEVAEKGEVRVVPNKSNNDCNITGADRLPDGHILLTDRCNKRLVRLDIGSRRMKDHITFQSEPWAVCVIHATEAAVSFPEEQKNIKFISITKKMRISRVLKLRHTCRALAYNEEELLVSDQGIFVHVYSLDGTLLKKFSKDGHVESKLTDFHSIAAKDNLIVLTDWNEGLLAFDKDGKLMWKYQDRDLKRAGGICFDETGNILACGSQSINVIHINREGKKIGEIANTSNGLVYPTALCFDEQKSMIVVAQQEANAVVFRVR